MANIIKFGGGSGGSGNATAANLLAGKTATVDTGEITGTMPDRSGADIAAHSIDGTYMARRIYVKPQEGYYVPSKSILVDDADFVAGNIKNGVNIFGVEGTYKNEVINLTTDANGSTGTSAVLGSLKKVVAITIGAGLNTRNSAKTLTMKVQGSSDGGTTWSDLLGVNFYSGVNSKASYTNFSNNISGTYNRFRIVSNLVNSYWEFLYYGHATVVIV